MTNLPPLSYVDRHDDARPLNTAVGLGIAGCTVAVIATVAPLPSLWAYAHHPVGSRLRPMDLAIVLLLCAAASLFVALPLGIASFGKGLRHARARRWGAAVVLLAFVGTVGGFWLSSRIESARHYVMLP